jgi:NAD(P)-dependent dehydrogenase (short-subunit alcohol dehydrogenase family)
MKTRQMFDLAGRVAIVTGGSAGLCQLCATNRSGRSAAADATSKDFRG